MSEKKGQQRCFMPDNFYSPNVAILGFWRIVPYRKLHFKTEKAYVPGLAGGAFRGRPKICLSLFIIFFQIKTCKLHLNDPTKEV